MWPPWAKIPRGNTAPPAAAAANPLRRSSFSFKDLHALLSDIDEDFSTTTHTQYSHPPPTNHVVKACVCRRPCSASSAVHSWRSRSLPVSPPDHAPSSPEQNRIILYFTTLRAVRKTFEDCRSVRSILHGLGVAVDERDLSMDASFLAELSVLLGSRGRLSLPRVFIAGRCVGGADEIRHLHETGELKRMVEGFPKAAACDGCGGMGFVVCGHCHGSHKRYTEKAGFRTCTACNENGLVRCGGCSLPAL